MAASPTPTGFAVFLRAVTSTNCAEAVSVTNEPLSSQSDTAEGREAQAVLWQRIVDFCLERGWHAYLYVREDSGPNFGRVGVKVDQAGGYSFSSWGNTSGQAIRGIVMSLERDGFDA